MEEPEYDIFPCIRCRNTAGPPEDTCDTCLEAGVILSKRLSRAAYRAGPDTLDPHDVQRVLRHAVELGQRFRASRARNRSLQDNVEGLRSLLARRARAEFVGFAMGFVGGAACLALLVLTPPAMVGPPSAAACFGARSTALGQRNAEAWASTHPADSRWEGIGPGSRVRCDAIPGTDRWVQCTMRPPAGDNGFVLDCDTAEFNNVGCVSGR